MSHAIILPILLPLFFGALLLVGHGWSREVKRGISLLGCVALLPVSMFSRELACGQLVQPFASTVDVGRYWLSARRRRQNSQAMTSFADWLRAEAARSDEALEPAPIAS